VAACSRCSAPCSWLAVACGGVCPLGGFNAAPTPRQTPSAACLERSRCFAPRPKQQAHRTTGVQTSSPKPQFWAPHLSL
jgi:hypothetical protein